MKENISIYDAKTGETRIEQVEIEETPQEPPIKGEPTLEEKTKLLEDENEQIKENNTTQDILIDTTMLATDEVYTMLEPILEMIPQTMSLERSVSKMVDLYVAMVMRSLKTIEQVPARYREQVKEILAQLEK